MHIFLTTLEAISILLIIGVVGFWAISRNVVPLKVLDVISPIVIDISIPALIFANILTKFDAKQLEGWYWLPFAWIIYTFLILGITFLLGKFTSLPEFKLGILYPNSVFIPIALIPALFTVESTMMVKLFLFTIFSPVFVFNSYFYFYKMEGKIDLKKIFNPILIATLVSMLIVLSGTEGYVPDVFIKVSRMLGYLALPLVMILIGGNIFVDFKRRGKLNVKQIIAFVFTRNIAIPAFIFMGLLVLNLRADMKFLLFLMTIVPPLTAIPILVERAKGNIAIANQFVVFSLLTSSITIPLWLMLFNRYITSLTSII